MVWFFVAIWFKKIIKNAMNYIYCSTNCSKGCEYLEKNNMPVFIIGRVSWDFFWLQQEK